jgi:copper chaperone CopZ
MNRDAGVPPTFDSGNPSVYASTRVRLDDTPMDPARPNDPDPADPFNPERADHPVLETIEIATEGEDCDGCVRKLREPLMKINGVCDVKVDTKRERVIVTFDARRTHPPDLHDAILKSGYKPAPSTGEPAPLGGQRPLQ